MTFEKSGKMTREEKWQNYLSWRKQLNAYRTAIIITRLDHQNAPSQGAAFRTEMRTVLAGEYEKLKREESMYEILASLAEEGEENDAAQQKEIRLALEEMEQDRAVPAEKAVAYTAVLEESIKAWLQAKAEGKTAEYKTYAPYLDALIREYKEITALRRDGAETLYDFMLDGHQPGWNRERYDAFFGEMKTRIVPLLQEIMQAEPMEERFLHQKYPADGQRIFMKRVTDYMGFTQDWGRISESEHPLTTPVCSGDVRISTKYREYDPAQAVFSTVHEIGHAYFSHHLDPRFEGSMIADSVSAGMNESQSRLCENHLARSQAFWDVLYPDLKAVFPEQLGGISAEQFLRAAIAVGPSPVRTDADEVTYPLHILIRYELEKEMMDGALRAAELEEAWNMKYKEYLGICPANAAEGILQDMHWPYAYFGYFPTYALGSAAAAQIFSKMSTQIDVPACLRNGRISEIQDWLGERIHKNGALYTLEETIERACGEPFSAEHYFSYLEEKYRKMYGIQH